MNEKEYKKWLKKQKKKLKKLLDNDYPYDYSFLSELVKYKIYQIYEYYTKEYVNFPHENQQELVIKPLKECIEIFEKLDTDLKENHYVEEELYKRLFSIIGKYITYWWD